MRVTGNAAISHVIRLLWEKPHPKEDLKEEEHAMVVKTYEPDKDRDTLRRVVAQYTELANRLAGWLTDRGHRLVADFRVERMALQADARQELAASAAGAHKIRKLYSPVGPFCRYKRDALELYWQKVHYTRVGSKPKFFYVKKGRRGDYHLQELASLAKPYEKELVMRTEAEASVIRARWRVVVEFRRVIRLLESTLEVETK